MTAYITINKHTIAKNGKHLTNDAPIRIARTKSGKGEYCNEVAILDESGNEVASLVYSPHGAIMKCGARLVLKANHGVRVKA